MPDKAVPNIIYHYTTQEGLLGILKDGSLWTTKIHYLNDASELLEPVRIADNTLSQYAQQLDVDDIPNKDEKKEIVSQMRDKLHVYRHLNICVASFCKDGDLLSQWRAYGLPGSAYSIGFNQQKLIESINPYPFELHRCKYYEPDEYRVKVKEFIMQVISEAQKKVDVPEDFIGRFINMAATMKLNCFKEEDEWRIVSTEALSSNDEKFNFRPGKSILIPYYSLPLDLSSIAEIVVGPCPHPELAENAIFGLSHKYNLTHIRYGHVSISKIPFRSL